MKEKILKIIAWKLRLLARLTIAKYKPAIVGVTGNVGKTSAKLAIAAIMASDRRTRASAKNFNNELGLPLNIIGDFDSTEGIGVWFRAIWTGVRNLIFTVDYPEVIVLEYGVDRPGDMNYLLSIAKPQIGAVTAVGRIPVHVEFFSGPEGVAKEKSKLVSFLPATGLAILNADDPGIASLSKTTKAKIVTFGIKDNKITQSTQSGVQDIKNCPICHGKLNYNSYTLGHLGEYTCAKCGFKNPKVQISASNIILNKDFSTSLNLTILNHKQLAINYNLPGLYNAYNVLASAAISAFYKLTPPMFTQSIANFTPVFGRFQKIMVGKKTIYIFLIKNPTGANEVVKVLSSQGNLNLLVILNDNFADGTDVSWIWDTNWETLSQKTKQLTISGTRSWDMATRLKYANFKVSKYNVNEQIDSSIKSAMKLLNTNDTLVILPTYTALISLQKYFAKTGTVGKWHKN